MREEMQTPTEGRNKFPLLSTPWKQRKVKVKRRTELPDINLRERHLSYIL
jgi:hypothetical protein